LCFLQLSFEGGTSIRNNNQIKKRQKIQSGNRALTAMGRVKQWPPVDLARAVWSRSISAEKTANNPAPAELLALKNRASSDVI
jgi:hypothetical protein